MKATAPFVTLLMLLSACGAPNANSDSGSTTGESSVNVQDTPVEKYQARGTVRSITSNRKHVIVDHGDIPGFMSAMTMPFQVADTSIVTGVRPADSIAFEIEVAGPRIEISSIEIIR